MNSATTNQTQANTATLPARVPMEGAALLELAAKLILKGADYQVLSKKASISESDAARVHAEVFRQLWNHLQDCYGKDYLKARHFALVKLHEKTVRNCDRAVDDSFRQGKPNTRPYSHKNAALRLIALLEGHNAPTQQVITDERVASQFRPERMQQAMGNPRVRAAALALEEAISEAEQEQGILDVELDAVEPRP